MIATAVYGSMTSELYDRQTEFLIYALDSKDCKIIQKFNLKILENIGFSFILFTAHWIISLM